MSFRNIPIIEQKYYLSARWLKLLHHDVRKGLFTRASSGNSTDQGLYSIIDRAHKDKRFFRDNGKYEFLYEVPDGSFKVGYNRWRQSAFPLDVDELTVTEAPGFSPIHLDWPTATRITGEIVYFKGLTKSSGPALLDGIPGTNGAWYFSVGVTSFHNGKENLIPAHSWNTEVILWIKVPSKINTVHKFHKLMTILLSINFISD